MKLPLVCYAALLLSSVTNTEARFLPQIREDENDQCAFVPNVEFADQCLFVHEYCSTEEHQIGVINYLGVYYCTFHYEVLGRISATPLAISLSLFFIALGLTASEYLCPNLYTISKLLNLSDNIAGLTLLALGNSSPDVLSTYKAMSVGSGSLALSQLMGAALFITTVIIGSMALIHPFHVPRSSFVRDATFFLSVSALLFVSLWDSVLSVVNSVVLIVAYILYVVVVVLTHSIRKRRAESRLSIQRARNNFSMAASPSDVSLDTFDSRPQSDDDQETDVDQGSDEEEEYAQAHAGTYGLKMLLKELSKHSVVYQHFKRPFSKSKGRKANQDRQSRTLPHNFRPYSDEDNSEDVGNNDQLVSDVQESRLEEEIAGENEFPSDINEEHTETDQEDEIVRDIVQTLHREEDVNPSKISPLLKLLAPQLINFQEQDVWSKVYNTISFPAATLLRVSNPVRENHVIEILRAKQKFIGSEQSSPNEFEYDLDKRLLCLQSFIGANFVFYNGFEGTSSYWYFAFPIGFVFSSALTAIVHFNYIVRDNNVRVSDIWKLQLINYLMAGLGFVVSISWISVFATETISILKSVAIIFQLSDDILGVTVFAVGNSIGDFISNYTIAKMGMPIMAFGACFGGPLLSICSMGVSTLLTIGDHDTGYRIEKTPTISITSIALVLNIAMLLLLVSYSNWQINRRIGAVLIFNWIAATSLCIIYESVNK